MSEIPADLRVEPPGQADERTMLNAWLDFHRSTLLFKCQGLDGTQKRMRPVETSLMSLHGLIRHMADVERNWFQRGLNGPADLPPLFRSVSAPKGDWWPLDDADWEHDVAAWSAQCELSRTAAATHALDDLGVGPREDEFRTVSLRWIYLHMIEEYARHNGHADLIREMIDGAVGS